MNTPIPISHDPSKKLLYLLAKNKHGLRNVHEVDFLVQYSLVFVLLQFFYIVHFLMNNIKKCKSSNIKNFFAPHYYRLLLLGTLNHSPKGVHNNGS